ncbi:uroporphyrinogen-III C-methyltransferase [Melaminivora suipulveris]|uniref:uroporphyrinogen-III C-methyltransferase n=1 Tax=Melaminivora suipulveris TaxID=2109913 RepID=A0A2R3Q8W7_9BURK|nr:uroporphyrinogen-III C-methyltransferase [Melaminivora suipulveris]AVO48209.1 uroporphyrinogen-III C-methyltransferase [Melaminivora suipulveris]
MNTTPLSGAARPLRSAAARSATRHVPQPGRCTLVGAGPGDPELLTLKAARAIAAASVLLVDDLVGEDIVALAAPGARIVRVGKRGGLRSTPQAFIEKLMIAEVRRGGTVVRLKGGDPFIFGRGGEEVQALRAAGIEPQVINGVTSGLAAPTMLGVPLTHREHAQGVLLLTGHNQSGAAPTDWALLGATARQAHLTLVVYMGVRGARAIQDGLLAGGLPPHTPVAVVQHATLAHQRQAITTLSALAQTIARDGLASPSVIVVGDVVRGARALADAAAPAASGHSGKSPATTRRCA